VTAWLCRACMAVPGVPDMRCVLWRMRPPGLSIAGLHWQD
jgi:hypothetical protein